MLLNAFTEVVHKRLTQSDSKLPNFEERDYIDSWYIVSILLLEKFARLRLLNSTDYIMLYPFT